jgi:hypothetical protein
MADVLADTEYSAGRSNAYLNSRSSADQKPTIVIVRCLAKATNVVGLSTSKEINSWAANERRHPALNQYERYQPYKND